MQVFDGLPLRASDKSCHERCSEVVHAVEEPLERARLRAARTPSRRRQPPTQRIGAARARR